MSKRLATSYPGRAVPRASEVKNAEEVKGAARKAIDTQVEDANGVPNSNPKKRPAANWGIK